MYLYIETCADTVKRVLDIQSLRRIIISSFGNGFSVNMFFDPCDHQCWIKYWKKTGKSLPPFLYSSWLKIRPIYRLACEYINAIIQVN